MEDQPLWNQNRSERTLRAPRSNGPNVSSNSASGKSGGTSLPVIPPEKSKLNVSACEFIPKNLDKPFQQVMSKPANSSVQNRLKIHKEPETHKNQKLQDYTANTAYYSQGDSNFQYESDSLDQRRLRQLINTLTNDPGQYDNLLDIFKQTLRPYFHDVLALSSVTDILVCQAIDQQSFRYTAARLCYSIEQESPNFRAQLHITCSRELVTNPNKQGIVMFVAELYTQLFHENIYGGILTKAFKDLLQEGGESNVKCVCQALKLTGHSLEQYDKKALDEVMGELLNSRQYVSGTVLCLLDSVVNLRNSKWGYSSYSETSSSNGEGGLWEEEETNNVSTVFYNPDGNMLSSEETEFLASSLQSTDEYLIDSCDPDDLCDPEPEMDEEIQAAFKEFVKLSRR